MIRTLLFFVVIYILVKVISRMFLRSASGNRRNKARMFYQTFKNMSEQQKQQQQQQQQRNSKKNGSRRFEEIEEAEFEDITDDINSSKSAD